MKQRNTVGAYREKQRALSGEGGNNIAARRKAC